MLFAVFLQESGPLYAFSRSDGPRSHGWSWPSSRRVYPAHGDNTESTMSQWGSRAAISDGWQHRLKICWLAWAWSTPALMRSMNSQRSRSHVPEGPDGGDPHQGNLQQAVGIAVGLQFVQAGLKGGLQRRSGMVPHLGVHWVVVIRRSKAKALVFQHVLQRPARRQARRQSRRVCETPGVVRPASPRLRHSSAGSPGG